MNLGGQTLSCRSGSDKLCGTWVTHLPSGRVSFVLPGHLDREERRKSSWQMLWAGPLGTGRLILVVFTVTVVGCVFPLRAEHFRFCFCFCISCVYLLKQIGLLKMSLGVYFVPRITFKTCEHWLTQIVLGGKKGYLLLFSAFPPRSFPVDFLCLLQLDTSSASLPMRCSNVLCAGTARLGLRAERLLSSAVSFGERSWRKASRCSASKQRASQLCARPLSWRAYTCVPVTKWTWTWSPGLPSA